MNTADHPGNRYTGRLFRMVMNRGRVFILSALLMLMVQSLQPVCGEELVLDDRQLYRYATHLYKSGEYYRAITEYQRLLFFFPRSEFISSSKTQIGRSYMAGHRLDDAVAYWEQRLASQTASDAEFDRLKVLLGISLLDKDRSELFSFRQENIDRAMEQFSSIDLDNKVWDSVSRFSNEWRNRQVEGNKSPLLAGLLSTLLPGSGSAYSGRWVEGFYTLFITGLFYLATRDAIINDRPEQSTFFGLFTLTFYGGGIYTAVNSAYKHNDSLQAETLSRLRQKYGIWFIPATHDHPGRY